MTAQRDANGRFVKGNSVAKGNKGNTSPKWGNLNAMKDGWYSRYSGIYLTIDGIAFVIHQNVSVGVLHKDDYLIAKDKSCLVKDEVASYLIDHYRLSEDSFIKSDKKEHQVRGYQLYIFRVRGTYPTILNDAHIRNVIRP